MKTDTLKCKVVMLALLISIGSCTIYADISGSPVSGTDDLAYLAAVNQNEFLEVMVYRIKNDAIKAIIELVESFIKHNTDTFAQYINRCKKRLDLIKATILIPLKYRLDLEKQYYPGSTFCQILEKTHKLANDMAYKELATLIAILEEHRNSPEAQKATRLLGKLKPHLMKLISVATLEQLEKKMDEIYVLMAGVTPKVTQEFDLLKKLVKDLKTKTASIQKDVNVGIFTVISEMLQR